MLLDLAARRSWGNVLTLFLILKKGFFKNIGTNTYIPNTELNDEARVYGMSVNWEVEAASVNKLLFHKKIQNGNVKGSAVKGLPF